MALLGWTADYADPDNFLYVLLDSDSATIGSAGNIAFYRNPEVHKLNIQAQQEPDPAKRTEIYQGVQVIIHSDAPWVPLAHSKQILVFSKKVQGFVLYPTGDYHFETVTLSQ